MELLTDMLSITVSLSRESDEKEREESVPGAMLSISLEFSDLIPVPHSEADQLVTDPGNGRGYFHKLETR